MIHREPDEEPNLLPEPRDWDDARNMWLADLPAFRILDAIFQPEVERHPVGSEARKETILAWCRYADALKFSYQEINILTIAYQWIQMKRKDRKETKMVSSAIVRKPPRVRRVVRELPKDKDVMTDIMPKERPPVPVVEVTKGRRGRPRKEVVTARGNILEYQ